jgi:Right handed beta helix region
VLVANFSTGLKFAGQDFNFNGLYLQANSVGLAVTGSTANENLWNGLRLQRNGTGMLISGGYELNFFGGLVQSNDIGMLIRDCSNCEIEGFDIEGNSSAGIINRDGSNVFINNRFGGGAGDTFRLESGRHCVLLGNRVMGANKMFIGSQALGTVLLGNTFNGIVDQSKQSINFGNTVLKVR